MACIDQTFDCAYIDLCITSYIRLLFSYNFGVYCYIWVTVELYQKAQNLRGAGINMHCLKIRFA